MGGSVETCASVYIYARIDIHHHDPLTRVCMCIYIYIRINIPVSICSCTPTYMHVDMVVYMKLHPEMHSYVCPNPYLDLVPAYTEA